MSSSAGTGAAPAPPGSVTVVSGMPRVPVRFRPVSTDDSDVLPVILSMVLEGTSGNLATMPYYRLVSRHAHENDPVLVGMLNDMSTWIRDKYRSACQHEFHVLRVPITKTTDRRVRTHLDGECAICLRSLKASGRRLVRLKAASGNADECGHFFHRDCIGQWELSNLLAPKSCPLCRVELGTLVQTWDDHESYRPQF